MSTSFENNTKADSEQLFVSINDYGLLSSEPMMASAIRPIQPDERISRSSNISSIASDTPGYSPSGLKDYSVGTSTQPSPEHDNITGLSVFAVGNVLDDFTANTSTTGSIAVGGSSDQLRTWADNFASGADLLLFGCNVAATGAGVGFVQQLASLTGTDVAASRDRTGATAQGGNVVLEEQTGSIETSRGWIEQSIDELGVVLDATALSDPSTTDSVPHLLALGEDRISDPVALANWQQALADANQILRDLPERADYSDVLQQAFGNAGTDPTAFEVNKATLADTLISSGLQITVELRSAEELNCAAGAYAAVGHTGTERTYLNADWVASGVSAITIRQVLLEEIGHAIDQRLNAELDSPGDEGELFAARLLGQSLSEGQLVRISADADHQILALDGVQVAVQTSEVGDNGDAVFSITGTLAVGQTLTAAVATDDPDGNDSGGFSYTWQALSGTHIDGNTWYDVGTDNASYTIPSGDQGKELRLRVSYVDGEDNVESVTTYAGQIAVNTYVAAVDPEALEEFEINNLERPVFAETFSNGSRFQLDRMVRDGGFVSGASGQAWSSANYFFDVSRGDELLDVKDEEIIVYWSFRTDPNPGQQEVAKMYMYFNFTDPPNTPNPEPARITMAVRANAHAFLYVDPGFDQTLSPVITYSPRAMFTDADTIAKFRLRIRWTGGDDVIAEPSWWEPSTSQWAPLLAGNDPAVMTMGIATHLQGNTTFPSLMFQSPTDVPDLDTVLVTRLSYDDATTPPPPNTTLPLISLAVSPESVLENGAANLLYTFSRTGATTNPLTVNYSIGGTATNGSDYGLIPASVTFAAGSATATLTVDPTDDSGLEPDETVSLTLQPNAAYSIGTAGVVTGTILNDDDATTPPPPNTNIQVLDPNGTVQLLRDTSTDLVSVQINGVTTAVRYQGAQLKAAQFFGWQVIAAETVVGTNQNQILWKELATGRLHFWSLDNNWNQTGGGGIFDPNSTTGLLLQQQFTVDATGTPLTSHTTLSS